MWGNADESSGSFAADGTELGHIGDEGGRQDWADALDRDQLPVRAGEARIGVDAVPDGPFQHKECACNAGQPGADHAAHDGLCDGVELADETGAFLGEATAMSSHLAQGIACGRRYIGLQPRLTGDEGLRNQCGVELIGFAKLALGAGERPDAHWRQDVDHDAGAVQRIGQRPLVTASGFKRDGGWRHRRDVGNEGGERVGPASEPATFRRNPGLVRDLADIDADHAFLVYHGFAPRLVVRALQPMQPFGVKGSGQ